MASFTGGGGGGFCVGGGIGFRGRERFPKVFILVPTKGFVAPGGGLGGEDFQ